MMVLARFSFRTKKCARAAVLGNKNAYAFLLLSLLVTATHSLAEGLPWRLVRTPDPRGGPDLISTIKVADTLRSDADFAAMLLRCADAGRISIAFALIVPIPPRDRPDIVWRLDDRPPVRVAARVLQPPTLIGLEPEGDTLLIGAIGAARRLSVGVVNKDTEVRGEIDLDGTSQALGRLAAECAFTSLR